MFVCVCKVMSVYECVRVIVCVCVSAGAGSSVPISRRSTEGRISDDDLEHALRADLAAVTDVTDTSITHAEHEGKHDSCEGAFAGSTLVGTGSEADADTGVRLLQLGTGMDGPSIVFREKWSVKEAAVSLIDVWVH